jgi:hypothetical protein
MPAIVVSGALANKPGNGGAAWTRLSWALGFARLGCDVYFVEQLSPSTCVNTAGVRCPVDESVNLAYFQRVTRQFNVNATLLIEAEGRAIGMGIPELAAVADRAEMLLNISGHLTSPALKPRFRRRVFLDLDPGYTQFWQAGGLGEEHLQGHEWYFTVGENVGRESCPIPTGGIDWRPIRQPVLLDEWPVAPPSSELPRFTTVASWRGPLGRVTHNETTFGVKAHEFRKFADLPARAGLPFEIALEVDPADQPDVDALTRRGWTLVDPKSVVPDPDAFRRYVQQSGAEFSVAQGIYVETQSGWFSDRTVRYLSSGKPALVQDTGWSRNIPSGCGLIAFRTVDEAASGAERIARDYQQHSLAARRIAEEFFDSATVLGGLRRTVAGK